MIKNIDTSKLIFHDFRKYAPMKEGWYIWRLPHKFIKDVTIIFLAEHRWRGAGYQEVLSPEFDRWTGFQVLLPKGSIEWAEYSGEKPKCHDEIIEIVGAKNTPCPFCKQEPMWKYSGRYIGAGPTESEYFYLKCCGWFNGFGMRMGNPLKLVEKRNQALAEQ